ncbi:MAG: NYN domain-containing protein [Anaerolineae bacterium]
MSHSPNHSQKQRGTKPLKKIAIDKDHPYWKLYGYTFVYKANFDVEMTADILLERADLDCVILFSGDSDFAELGKRLGDLGKAKEEALSAVRNNVSLVA